MEEYKLFYILIGAGIALLSREIGRYLQMNISYNLRQHEQYARKSQEIIDAITNIVSLHIKLTPNKCSVSNMKMCEQAISELYFKHYNYLPQEVLNALNCLFLCLSSNGKYLYIIAPSPLTTFEKIKYRLGFKQLRHVDFKQCKKSSDFITRDFKKMILSSNASDKIEKILKRPEECIPNSMKLNLQARYVIYVIHKYFQKPYLQTWDTYLLKHNIFKHK